MNHTRTGRKLRLSSSQKLFGRDRETVDEAYPGDVVGLIGHSDFRIGDTLAEDPAQSAIREITLGLDVPQVDRSERAYDRMREAAQALARAMDGVVTDSNGLPLIGETMDVFALELEGMYNTLDERELSAGSALARRLFS